MPTITDHDAPLAEEVQQSPWMQAAAAVAARLTVDAEPAQAR